MSILFFLRQFGTREGSRKKYLGHILVQTLVLNKVTEIIIRFGQVNCFIVDATRDDLSIEEKCSAL